MSSVPAVQLQRVSFAYGAVPVLEEVSLSIGARDAVCIVGPNGGGKTTLLKLFLGLLRPGAGKVRLLGEAPAQTRSRVGYMPQHLQFDAMFPATALDVVLMGRLGQPGWAGRLGWYTRQDRLAARKALEEVEMETLHNRSLAALSGGQRQRVLIARALCCEPELLLLDEPTANVDVLGEARLAEILRTLNQRMALVMVSHDLGFVSSMVRSVICVNRRVVVHPTSEITTEVIHDLYGGDRRLVRHDERRGDPGVHYE